MVDRWEDKTLKRRWALRFQRQIFRIMILRKSQCEVRAEKLPQSAGSSDICLRRKCREHTSRGYEANSNLLPNASVQCLLRNAAVLADESKFNFFTLNATCTHVATSLIAAKKTNSCVGSVKSRCASSQSVWSFSSEGLPFTPLPLYSSFIYENTNFILTS
jgi:hypothetical protein